MGKEKKEIGKLLELLNEYDGDVLEYGFVDGDIRRKVKNFDNERNTWKSVVWYTKEFGFIKWLVENDKIDCNKSIFTVDGDYGRDDVIYEIERQNYYILNEQYGVDFTDCILMLLAIQDEPIEFLCRLLK